MNRISCPKCGFETDKSMLVSYDKKNIMVEKDWEKHIKICYNLKTFKEIESKIKYIIKAWREHK